MAALVLGATFVVPSACSSEKKADTATTAPAASDTSAGGTTAPSTAESTSATTSTATNGGESASGVLDRLEAAAVACGIDEQYYRDMCDASTDDPAAVDAERTALCELIVGSDRPPEFTGAESSQSTPDDNPELQCGYLGRDAALTYDTDEANTEFYVTVEVALSAYSEPFWVDEQESAGVDPAELCARLQGRSDTACLVAGDDALVVTRRDLLAFVDGVQVEMMWRNAGDPTAAVQQARLAHVLEALGVTVPDEFRDLSWVPAEVYTAG